jgi:MFS superfamily sulfate permease-like transporter
VVFLVALPLCLGIAMASGAPLMSGIISGVIGGIVVGFLSKSHISVSGPAAGLTAIILTAITDLGAFDIFLTAAVLWTYSTCFRVLRIVFQIFSNKCN